jgi:hypothetical protein
MSHAAHPVDGLLREAKVDLPLRVRSCCFSVRLCWSGMQRFEDHELIRPGKAERRSQSAQTLVPHGLASAALQITVERPSQIPTLRSSERLGLHFDALLDRSSQFPALP